MTTLQRKAVVGDIGGTHARFGIIDIDELRIDHFVSFECASFPSLEDALGAYLRSVPHHPKTISLAIAGPVIDGQVTMTNRAWSPSTKSITAVSGAEHVCLVNDFEALALALPYLGHHDIEQIGGSHGTEHATRVVTGAGTGLGIAALAWTGRAYMALPGEGGHMAFAPQTEIDFDIVKSLGQTLGYISSEHLLSGDGLVRLHQWLQKSALPLTAPEIVRRASEDQDPVALQAVRLFAVWLGRFAGDLALLYGGRGGVYLGGGIAPKIYPFLSDGHFRAAFEAKGALSDYLADVPVYVIKSASAGLVGAALAYLNISGEN